MKQKKKLRKRKNTTATRKKQIGPMQYNQNKVFNFGNQKGIHEMGCKQTGKTPKWMR